MSTEVLGKLSFLEVPDVNGSDVLLNAGGVPSILSGPTLSLPAAAIAGRLYLDTDVNRFFRDTGTAWIDLTPVPSINGTANQIVVTPGTNVSPAVVALAENPVIPGTAGMRLPVGTTAERSGSPVEGDARFNSTLDRPEVYNGANWVPFGRILQMQTGTITPTSGTTQIPFDSTVPQNNEGFQIWTTMFTPQSAASRIIVEYTLTVSHGTATRIIITSLFTGGTSAVATASTTTAGANTPQDMTLYHTFLPGSTATITFSARLGSSAAGTCFVGSGGANTLGGTMGSMYRITEIL